MISIICKDRGISAALESFFGGTYATSKELTDSTKLILLEVGNRGVRVIDPDSIIHSAPIIALTTDDEPDVFLKEGRFHTVVRIPAELTKLIEVVDLVLG